MVSASASSKKSSSRLSRRHVSTSFVLPSIERVVADGRAEHLVVLVVVLVADLAHYLLEDVLEGDQSARAAVFVDDDGYVHLVGLELTEKVVHLLCLGHEVGGTHKALPTEIGGFSYVRYEVLDVEDAAYVVLVVLVDGYAAVVVVDDVLYHVGKGGAQLDAHNVLDGRS